MDSSPFWSQGFGPFAENGFREFHRAKMSYEDTQHKHNKLDFSSKNQTNWLAKTLYFHRQVVGSCVFSYT